MGRYYLIVASSQLVAERYEEAEATLQSGLAIQKIGSDPLMPFRVYTLFGDIAFRQNRTEEAFAYYDKALENNPQNYGALNNYSYYLALLGKNLDKAERMSGEVIKANPDNATYLDTYAWVYFKQGRYSAGASIPQKSPRPFQRSQCRNVRALRRRTCRNGK